MISIDQLLAIKSIPGHEAPRWMPDGSAIAFIGQETYFRAASLTMPTPEVLPLFIAAHLVSLARRQPLASERLYQASAKVESAATA